MICDVMTKEEFNILNNIPTENEIDKILSLKSFEEGQKTNYSIKCAKRRKYEREKLSSAKVKIDKLNPSLNNLFIPTKNSLRKPTSYKRFVCCSCELERLNKMRTRIICERRNFTICKSCYLDFKIVYKCKTWSLKG